jgi:hypothetical protein
MADPAQKNLVLYAYICQHLPTDHATTESRKTSWLILHHHPNTTSPHGYWNPFVSSMPPATAGWHDAQHFAGGRAPMNALLLAYLTLIVVAFIVIVILENNDDGGAA